MKIAVNARYAHRRTTGVERYAAEISLRLFPPNREIRPFLRLPPLAGHVWEQIVLPARLNSNESLWSPANAGPWIVRRQAVTLHDASVFDHPEWFKPAFAAWTRLSWMILARQAKAIFTVSNFSRERLKFHLGVPDEKIHVIPNGVGRPFEPISENAIQEVRAKHRLTKPYFLFVGTLEPRKNLSMLVEAWELLQGGSKVSVSKANLVIAGTEGSVFAPVGSHAESVTYLGYVPDSDLPALYSGAVAVVVPSLYEGFGLTALEAMACGTPVIASNTSSFPETLGDAAILVDPNDPGKVAETMYQVVEDRSLADELRARGLKRAKQFSWDDSAHRIQELVESL